MRTSIPEAMDLAKFELTTPLSTSFHVEQSTFGIWTVPVRQLVDLTERSEWPQSTEFPAGAEREFDLSTETVKLLQQGMADAAEGRVTAIPPELYQAK